MQHRKTSRYLLFDQNGRLFGKSPTPSPTFESLGFSGIHVISPRLLSMMPPEEIFSIITCYLVLAARGEHIAAFHADAYEWKDLGRPENLK
jgi:NDP-sugar pyrophosphorylase family protein